MSLPSSLRSLLPLVIGLVVGAFGASSFLESMPGSAGSPEERANALERELKKAQNRIEALEAGRAKSGLLPRERGEGDSRRKNFADGARGIAEDLRAGRPVSPEDIFRASQPLIRDLAPLFDRMRVKQQRQVIDTMAGELARKYNLSPEHQAALGKWFEFKMNEEAKRWTEMVGKEGTRLEDVARASQTMRPDDGLDVFMEGILSGEQLTSFKSERLAQRAERVQQEADRKVQQLNGIVGLDDAQRDQVFGIMARGSRDYDPSMVLDGAQGEIGPTPSGSRQAAVLGVLRPEQRAAYEAEQQRRRAEAAKDLESMGLAMPPDWQMFDDEGFR